MEYKEHKNFLEVEELICRDFYEYYRANRKKTVKGINQYKYFEKTIASIFTIIRATTEESTSGVYIKDFGYFCVAKSRIKKRSRTDTNPLTKFKKRYNHNFWFLPIEKYENWNLLIEITNFKINFEHYNIESEAIKMYYEISKPLLK